MLDNKEAAALLRVSQSTLWRLRRKHGLPFMMVGFMPRYDREALLAWAAKRAEGQTKDQKAEA